MCKFLVVTVESTKYCSRNYPTKFNRFSSLISCTFEVSLPTENVYDLTCILSLTKVCLCNKFSLRKVAGTPSQSNRMQSTICATSTHTCIFSVGMVNVRNSQSLMADKFCP